MKLSIVDTNVRWRRQFFVDAALRRAREAQRPPTAPEQPQCACGDCVPCEFRRARARRGGRR